jgi:hypothetical protein
MKRIICGALAAAILCAVNVEGAPYSSDKKEINEKKDKDERAKAKMIQEIRNMKTVFKTGYAPAEWKKEQYNWDVNTAAKDAINQINNTDKIGIKDYHKIVRNFFRSTKDYHVSVGFNSTERSHLPLKVAGAEGRYFVTEVDRDRLSESVFPIFEGDEVLSFDGRPIADVIAEIVADEMEDSNSMTGESLAEMKLTNRSGRRGHFVPKGGVVIEFGHLDGSIASYQLKWVYTPEAVAPPKGIRAGVDLFSASLDFGKRDSKPEEIKAIIEKGLMASPFAEGQISFKNSKANSPNNLGAREGFLPRMGEVLWEADQDPEFDIYNPYDAYMFKTEEGKRVGYVRIPHYVFQSDDFESFKQIIRRFEAETDVLLIDQTSNYGGYVFNSMAVLSTLTNKAMPTPKHHLKITQEDVVDALEILEFLNEIDSEATVQMIFGPSFMGYPTSMQFIEFIKGYFEFVISEWSDGRSFTAPTHLHGVDYVNPNPEARYTKPILMLINHLDFSCGDFVPATLQDAGRVTLLGTRTAGAGGSVTGFNMKSDLGVARFTYTWTLGERANLQPIENLAVTPDIEYELTAEDLQNEYAPFVGKILETVETMVAPIHTNETD